MFVLLDAVFRMKLLGRSDLRSRWTYTRQGVHKVLKWRDCPRPYLSADRGRLAAWLESDIEVFERGHPELLDEDAKRNKSRQRSRSDPSTALRGTISNSLYLGVRDLTDRWTYTYQGVRRVILWSDFPDPAFVFNQGRAQVWHIGDIEPFETAHKELINRGIKAAKQRWYARHLMDDF